MLPCIAALCLQLGVGVAHANPQDCGIWYTCGPDQPHTLHLNGLDWSVGLASEHWRFGYEDAGNTSVEARVPAFIDRYPGPMAQFNGNGWLRGVYGMYSLCAGKLCLEAGPWFYKAMWAETLIGIPGRPYIINESAVKLSPGAIGGVTYRLNNRVEFAADIRSANNFATAGDGGLMQSITKGFTTTFVIRFKP